MKPRLHLPFSLFGGMSLVTLGNGLFGTLIGLRLEGVSSFALGGILAAYYAGITLGALLGGALVARIGHVRAFSIFIALLVACILCFTLQDQLWFWAVLRFGCGIAVAGLMLIVEGWLTKQSAPEQRGTIFGIYMLIIQTGLGLGPLLLHVGEIHSHKLFVLTALLYALAAVPVTLTRYPQPELALSKPLKIIRLIKVAPIGMLGCFIAGSVTSVLLTLGPVFAQNHGLSTGQIAAFMSATIISGVIPQYPIGWLSDRLDRRLVLSMVAVVIGIGSVLLAFFDVADFFILITFGGFLGGLTFTLYPLSLSHTHDNLEPHEMIGASGILILLFGIGATLGPAIGTAMMAYLGNQGLFATIAGACILLILSIGLRAFIHEPTTSTDKTHFVPITLPQAAPRVGNLEAHEQLELPLDD